MGDYPVDWIRREKNDLQGNTLGKNFPASKTTLMTYNA